MSAALEVEGFTVYINGSSPPQINAEIPRVTHEIDFTDTELFFAAIQLIFKHRTKLQSALIFMLAAQNNSRSGAFASTFENQQSMNEVRSIRVSQAEPDGRKTRPLKRKALTLVEMLRDDFIKDLYLALAESTRRATELSGMNNHHTLRHAKELKARIPKRSHDYLRALYSMALIQEEGGHLFVSEVIGQLAQISNRATAPPRTDPRPFGLKTNMSSIR